jgi:hypothetical protein
LEDQSSKPAVWLAVTAAETVSPAGSTWIM